MAVLFRVALRRGRAPAAAAALALALSAWAAEPRFVERPHLVTFLGLALTLLALERAESGRPRALYALVPCGLVWANANSCFFLAPLVLALYALGARLDGRPADARRAALCAAALVPLIFATPSGVHALGYIANHWRMPWLRPLEEYVPARWPDNAPAAFVAAGVVARGHPARSPLAPPVARRAAGPGRRAPQPLPRRVRAAFGADRRLRAHGRRRPRHGAHDRGAAPGAATHRDRRRRRAVRRRGDRAARRTPRGGASASSTSGWIRRWSRRPRSRSPTDNGLRDRMYNDMEVGSYLTWEGWPRHRVFQDPRINGYPPAFHALLRRDDLSRAEWDALLAGFGVATALVTYPGREPARRVLRSRALGAGLPRRRRPGVRPARGPSSRRWSRAPSCRVTLRLRSRDRRQAAGRSNARPAGSPVTECEWQRRLGDFFAETQRRPARAGRLSGRARRPGCLDDVAWLTTRMALGDAALRLHDPATAAEAYAGIDLPRAHTNRGARPAGARAGPRGAGRGPRRR